MTDNNADETEQNSKLSRRTAMALMGTSAVGGAAATSAFSQLTADRPVDLSVNANDLDVSFDGTNNQLTLTNNSGSSVDATIAIDDSLTSLDDLVSQTLNGATLDASNENQPVVTGISDSSSVTLNFGRFTGSSTVNFETQWDNGFNGFDVATTKSGSVGRLERAFLFGGKRNGSGLNSTYEFGEAGSYIGSQTDFPNNIADGQAATVNGKVYIMGWDGTDGTIYEYDPAVDSFSAVRDDNDNKVTTPNGYDVGSVVEVNGIIYYLAGRDNNSDPTNVIYEFDPSVPSVSQVTDSSDNPVTLPVSVRLHSAAVVNGIVYICGGYNGSNVAAIQQFDPSGPSASRLTDSSSNNIDLPNATRELSATAVNGNVYVLGGKGSAVTDAIIEIDPSAPSAAQLTDGSSNDVTLPKSLRFGRSAEINGTVYHFGGENGSSEVNDIYALDLSGPSISAATDDGGNTVTLPNSIGKQAITTL